MPHACPICAAPLPEVPRYPRYLCGVCADRTTDATGRPVVFYNEGPWGGFIGRYADDDTAYAQAVCFVDGRRCRAGEARFGGIVVELDEPDGARRD